MKKPLTYSPEGLTKLQVNFLNKIEKAFFEGADINRDLMYKEAIKHKGTPEAKEIIEAFDYWLFLLKPLNRQSLIKPVKLTTYLKETENGFWLRDTKNHKTTRVEPTHELTTMLKDHLIYELSPKNYYFEIIEGRLFIKYQHIIGSRYIANITVNIELKG